MPRKPTPKPDDPEQSKRFIEMAREVGADETERGQEAFERTLKKIVRPESGPGRSKRGSTPSRG